jgi:hypothetical protein
MKRMRASVFCVMMLMIFGMCWPAFGFGRPGWGIESDPYVITTVEQLQEMSDDLAACYALGNDIDASVTLAWNG